MKRICLHGPESVGKSRLAAQLAAHFGTNWVPEYGRTYCEEHGTDLDSAQLLDIAQVQQAMAAKAERAAAPHGRDLIVLDTDPLMTAVWCDMMGLPRDPWFAAFDDFADLYLLCDIDLPWVDDGTRIYGDVATRERFFAACREELVARGVDWVLVGGTGEARLENALAAIGKAVKPSLA
ncbi:ATP-binding protein [Sphingomonas sp. SUN039]|uniref:ATP-binding protein n=1 Tax=Sphingomonas sp. SUN039 TaxID=2937787 RepID=UPI002164A0CE|nr:ATP-binding protein [Sphingomonas sp. SUN039]UVO52949.1 ATP-binding protein [Sphingomonas sp. SUN039]